tara:strand:+ start:1825 stop:2028 length:204 start_codon:yes stop_codon:yes gene_type:complete
MKPVQPNYKGDLKQIKTAIDELAIVVSDIKEKLAEVNGKVNNVNQLSVFDNPNASYTIPPYTHEEEK